MYVVIVHVDEFFSHQEREDSKSLKMKELKAMLHPRLFEALAPFQVK